MSDPKTTQHCCPAWDKAQTQGTDNEGWGALINCWNGTLTMGIGLAPIRFCPWCGSGKKGNANAE